MPAEAFPGWSLARRAHMTSDGKSGVASLDNADVRRVTSGVKGDSDLERAPSLAVIRYVKYHFQIPESILSPLVVVTTNIGALYVHKMNPYVSVVSDDLFTPWFVRSIGWEAMCRGSSGVSPLELCNISWYVRVMMESHHTFQRDYDALRAIRAESDANSYQPRSNMPTLSRVPFTEIL